MTIVAGFRFSNGVLLCADTQVHYGNALKTQGSKLSAWDLNPTPVKIAYAMAGALHTATAVITEINLAIQNLPEGSATRRKIIPLIKKCLAETYKNICAIPTYDAGADDFYLIIALETPDLGVGLFFTDKANVNGPIKDLHCTGSEMGQCLFKYLVEPIFDPNMDLEELIILATHALREVKATVPFCGESSEFLIYSSGRLMFSGIAEYDIAHIETFSKVLQRAMYDLLFVMADLRRTQEDIDRARTSFQDNLTNIRWKYLEDKNHRIAMGKLVKYLSEPGTKNIRIEFKRENPS